MVETTPTYSNHSGNPINVHIIDGYRCTAAGVKTLIEQTSGIKVNALSHTIAEARESIANIQADIILLEPELPTKCADELIPLIVEKSNARILLFSATSQTELLDNAILMGANGIVSKTESPQQLLKAIQCVHNGEVWLNRNATARVLVQAAKMNQGDNLSREERMLEALSGKERKVFEAVVAAPDSKMLEIAELLNISQHTLRNHLASVYAKLGINNRLSLYAFAKNSIKRGS